MKNSTLLHGKRNDAMNKSSRKGVKPLALVVFLLAFVGMARADEVTVYDGTTTNNYVPAYVFYFDDFTKSQYVIPANDLAEVNGGTITSVKFYTTGNNMPYTTVSTVDVYLKEVDYTMISAFEAKDDCQVVYTGTMEFEAEGEGGFCLITFDTPFTYYGGNLLVGCENTTDAGWKNIYFYGQTVDGASVAGYNSSSLDGVNPTQRNFIPKTTFYYLGETNLVTTPDPIDLGYRPNGAWMHPMEVNIFNYGTETTINNVAVTNNNYFQLGIENINVPFTLGHNVGFDVNLSTVGNASGVVNGNLVVNYGDNEVTLFDVSATAYTPVSPDVWEHAQLVSSFPFTATLNANSVPLYDNYRLPPASIADGADAVYKLVFTKDTYLNASVTSGENGKIALYPEGFHGVGGPDLTNNYTAPEVPIEEWLHYDNGDYYESWYTNWGDCIWGIKFSPDQLVAYTNCNLTKVSVFDSNSNYGLSTYTINIYVGGNTPDEGMLVHTQDFEPYADNTFHEVFLTEAVEIDPSQNLWITLQAQANGGYPIACCRNVEDPNGRWYYYDSSWIEFTGFNNAAWMLRGFVTNTEGRTIAIEYGNRDNLVYDFDDSSLQGWTTIDADGDGYTWVSSMNPGDYHNSGIDLTGTGHNSSAAYVISGSWANGIGQVLYPDNYLISPQITLGGSISFYACAQDASYAAEHFGVAVSTTNNTNASAFTTIQEWTMTAKSIGASTNYTRSGSRAQGVWYQYTVDLSAYAGQTGYIAIRHFDCADQFILNVDDIVIAPGEVSSGSLTDLTVTPGTYYLVASSISDEWSIEINAGEVPCPDPAYSPFPANYAEVNPNRTIELSWQFGQRATEYKLMFGTTESCEQTLVDWTRVLGHQYMLPALLDNMTYYWKVVERNDDCSEGVESPVWSFTTRLNTPQNLYAEQDFIMEGNSAVLYWSAPNRALQYYNVYQDGMLIGSTTDTYYVVEGLNYNMNGYAFYVTAVFDAGESDPSNYVWIYVSGLGTVNGHVYEQDDSTGIENAMVTFTGYDEYGYYNTYSFTTDSNGYYEGSLRAGSYVVMASCAGYQDKYYGGSVGIMFNNLTSGINISLDELFNPVTDVVAEYYPDANDPSSPYVQVRWGIDDSSNWLYYDDGVNVDAIGLTGGGSLYWGVMFPAGTFAGNSLKKVSMYDYVAHTGNIMVYQGGTSAPETLLYMQPYICTGSMDFVEWTLNTPVGIDSSQHLWIVMNNNDGQYVASCCANTGDANGRWISVDGSSWDDLVNYGLDNTWMLRAYVSNGTRGAYYAPIDFVTTPSNIATFVKGETNNVLSVSGNTTTHNVGVPTENVGNNRAFSHYKIYRTNAYNNGPYNTENTVLLADNVTDTVFIDVTWQDAESGIYKWGVSCVYEGNRESEINWNELNQLVLMPNRSSRQPQPVYGVNRESLVYDFDDSSLQGWTTIDADGDGYTWVSSMNPGNYHNAGVDLTGTGHNASAYYVISGSWANGIGQVLYPDNYLVSPQITLGGSISFWACAQDASYAADHFGVAVSTTSSTIPNAFATIQEWTMTAKSSSNVTSIGRDGNTRAQGNWYQYTVDLSAFSGMGYVAIRHFNCSDQFILNVDDITIVEGTGTGGLLEPRESEIVWSNFLDKDMFLSNGEVDISVTLNSGDSPAGTTVRFTNLNAGEQQFYPIADVILDGTGYYVWDSFRKGDYQVTITKDGYETIIDNIGIWDATSLSYIMTEIVYNVSELYVSRTGWVKWNPQGDPSTPSSGGNDSFEFSFENDFEGWTTINNDGDSLNWVNSINSVSASGYDYTGLAHGGNYFVYSQSYVDYVGAYNADNYLVSPQKYSITNGSTLSFWADNGSESYPDHFAIAIATADTPGASDFVDVWSHSGAKSESKAATRYAGNRYQNWRLHSVDLSSYAGQDVWIAFHHQDYDMYEIWIDDVTLTTGAKSSGDRHLEYYQVRCENSNHEPIFSINTTHNFCQVATEGLVEGEQYICKVAAVYSSGMSAYKECTWEYEPCDHWGPVDNVVVYANEQGNHIEWMFENGYNPYGSNKSSIGLAPQHSDIWGDGSDYQMLKGGEFYSQYAEDGIMLNFFALDNVDLRAFLLYNLSNDSRFSLVPEDEYGQFVLTSNEANNNFMDEFEMAYQKAIADFSLLSKVDIDDNMVIWKSSVAPTNYLSIMMDVITARTRTENDHCLNSIPFCTSDVISFNAASTSQTADQLEGIALQDGCIGASYNPSWYHMRIHTAGQFIIHMEGHDPTDGSERDVDYCIWGPFTNPYLPCVSDLTTDKIIDCNYSAYYAEDIYMGYPENEHQHQASHGTMNYHMPEIGEYYIMMITNFSRQPCNITFTKTEGVGETDCDIINTTGIIGFLVTEDGEYVAIAGPDDREYTVEGEFGEHEYCVRPIYPGEMQLPTQNYGWSMGCPQIASIDEENHWNVDIHQYPYNMNVTGIIQINGVEQQTPTLEIGAFCGDECRGTQRLTYFPQVDRYLVFLTLYGDAGDVMSFRLYDHALGQELDLSCSSTITFVPDGFMGNAFDPYVFSFGNTMAEQVSNFSQGYNWWGTYIEQEGIDGLGMLQNGLGDNGVTIRSQASGYTDYYQGYGWYGSLSSINNESSYRVITSAPCTVTMTGNVAVPSQHPITLSQGWTWIGYVPSTTMSVDAALANLDAVQGDKLKSQQGYADYYVGYGWYGSLNTIEPGMGLMYYSTNGNPISFTYPDNGRGGELRQNLTAENNHWVPNVYAYPDNMTVMAVVEFDNVELSSDNYELAAFTANGECRGSVRLTYAEPLHRHVAFLTISGKDAAELSFRLYDTEMGVEYYDAEESLDFVADAIVGESNDLYVIHFRGNAGMDEFASRVKVYPNPVSAGERFSIGMNIDIKSPVRVEIVNALGAVVSVETSTQAPASIVAPITAGVYTLRITVEGKGTAVRKLVVK